MNLRFVDWIWHIRGSLTLAPEQSSDDVFARLDHLFRQAGTSHDRSGNTLIFRKKGQAAQDKMSVFNGGTLRIEGGAAGSVLRYHLTSRALLFCFLVPLLFLGIAQLTIALDKFAPDKAPHAVDKPTDKKAVVPMNPIDKALGAPSPDKNKKSTDKLNGRDKKPTPAAAYVFAAIFAALYVVGRLLEDRLLKLLFRKSILDT